MPGPVPCAPIVPTPLLSNTGRAKPDFRWRWNYKTSWIDERLRWPSGCQIEGKTNDFVKSAVLNYLWNAVDFMSDVGGDSKKQNCQNTIQITQVQCSEIN